MTTCYETIESQVSAESLYSYGYRAMHTNLRISDVASGDKLVVPYRSLSNKYREYLKDYVLSVTLDDAQYQHFRGNPQAFSEFVYGTTQHWGLILELNNCPSRINFNLKTIKYYDPIELTMCINNILLKEEQVSM